MLEEGKHTFVNEILVVSVGWLSTNVVEYPWLHVTN